LKFDNGTVNYRWKADEPAFNMPIQVGTKDHWQLIEPTTTWQTMTTPLTKEAFGIPENLYYINVEKD